MDRSCLNFVIAIPRRDNPTQGNIGTKSLLEGGVSENPTQANQRVSKVGQDKK